MSAHAETTAASRPDLGEGEESDRGVIDESEPIDGRRLRSARSRDAVVDALLAMYQEGIRRPGAAQIAERAGVSERSVFRHFDDLDALVEATAERMFERMAHLFTPLVAHGPRRARMRALVEHRLASHDAAAPVLRAAVIVEPVSSRLQSMFASRRRLLSVQVERQFAVELRRRDEADRAELTHALSGVLSLEFIEHLRYDLDIARDETASILERAGMALLSSRMAPG